MASKSNLTVVIDDEGGTSLVIQDDASGFTLLSMTDGNGTKEMKISSVNSNVLKNALAAVDTLRRLVPRS